MWIIAIIAIIASLTGYASITSQIALASVADAARVRSFAANMASYRAGVVNFANANSAYAGEVAVPVFPAGYAALTPPQWSNAVLTDGTVAVYSIGISPPGLIKGIAVLAQGSVLAGRANTLTGRIEAPGATSADQVPLPALPAGITNGAAIWLAHRD
ncbi:type IV pilus biogenesis protein PilM [Actimicrobium sp. CCC2.4]|uniref:type IV pilus biogenesis protein PilM n=1 Tax=Actimicrobium sp. CCC2.4 TaxID=3048606 RepID=UPI002AC89FA6|nr:type IV pilus biogenesis protein PilM [Actimicrobium sp. CCC2.4]MEB0134421.1 type IV pilus biogenesis protein PilM [Actimicrobium sp. CCC2.4]WPX33057.1 type IV pilus biogenesis protein PilM [Actimicrobium sp. CCC2.4]